MRALTIALLAVALVAAAVLPSDATIGDVIGHGAAVVRATPRTSATIEGPTEITAGATAFLKLSEATEWVSWKLLPPDSGASFMSFQSFLGMTPDNKPIIQHIGIFSTMTPGTYYFSVAASGQVHVIHTIVVKGDKPDPEPDPEPDPDPFPVPPAKLFVLVLAETGDRTAAQAATMHELATWMKAEGIRYRIEDPDLKASWIGPYKQRRDKAGVSLPALFIGRVDGDNQVTEITVAPLPVSGAAAIEAVKARVTR